MALRYEGVVDLRRFPINDPASPQYRDLVRSCRDQLRDYGVAQLAGFLTPAAVGEMLALAGELTPLGADLRGTSGDEAERAHPAALLRPNRLTSPAAFLRGRS
jgi:hypothetical protein